MRDLKASFADGCTDFEAAIKVLNGEIMRISILKHYAVYFGYEWPSFSAYTEIKFRNRKLYGFRNRMLFRGGYK